MIVTEGTAVVQEKVDRETNVVSVKKENGRFDFCLFAGRATKQRITDGRRCGVTQTCRI